MKLPTAQLEILRLMAEGHTERQIAQSRGTSENTVHNQISGIRERFNVRSGAAAVAAAVKAGLLDVDTLVLLPRI